MLWMRNKENSFSIHTGGLEGVFNLGPKPLDLKKIIHENKLLLSGTLSKDSDSVNGP